MFSSGPYLHRHMPPASGLGQNGPALGDLGHVLWDVCLMSADNGGC
jgi:hypothetical protein